MNREIKTQWVAALRSGDYQQTRKCLARKTDKGTGYCCLGVLCDLAVKAGVIPAGTLPAFKAGELGNDEYLFGAFKNAMTLPEEVQAWAGLDTSNPKVSSEPLGAWNDGDDMNNPAIEPENFTQIADRIEREL